MRTALWWMGLIFTIQGFGSGITEALWHESFGVSGVLIGSFDAPAAVSWLIGVIGSAFLVWAAALTFSRAR
ncbi:hypothetical protein [Actinomadura sp. 6N118]|uniref:hypothetical protein n=1 Tax=Actinomadura sp. 6N118 TaxID=3375151 RepID=UPI00379ADB3D